MQAAVEAAVAVEAAAVAKSFGPRRWNRTPPVNPAAFLQAMLSTGRIAPIPHRAR